MTSVASWNCSELTGEWLADARLPRKAFSGRKVLNVFDSAPVFRSNLCKS